MLRNETRYLLAAIQALIAGEWIISGSNKLVSGAFPQGLADALSEGIKDNPNVWYVSWLQALVVPHSVAFGYLIEFGELAIGLGLLAGALVLVGKPRMAGDPQHRMYVTLLWGAVVASLGCAFLCVNFHFWMGDGVLPTPSRIHVFDEGIDLDTLMAPLALVVAVANYAMVAEAQGYRAFAALRTRVRTLAGPTHGATATR
ncbi:MAG: hypothetical protein ACXWQZ_02610 [Ktedonobacterales bacterium]